jgi:Outer membrane protein beta-barrel domain
MNRTTRIAGCALAAVLLGAPQARAQAVELSAFGGLGFGGELIATPGYEAVSLQAGPLYGGAFNVEFRPRWRFEALVMREESKVSGPAHGPDVDVDVDRYMVGVQSQERLSPSFDIFGEFMLGATRFMPTGDESELWFTFGVAAGVKTYVTRNIGIRFEFRGYYTPVAIGGAAVCGGYGCVIGYAGTGTFSGDISAGVLIGF